LGLSCGIGVPLRGSRPQMTSIEGPQPVGCLAARSSFERQAVIWQPANGVVAKDEHQASRPTIGWRLLSAQNDSASPGAGDDPASLRDGPDAGAGAGGRRVSRHRLADPSDCRLRWGARAHSAPVRCAGSVAPHHEHRLKGSYGPNPRTPVAPDALRRPRARRLPTGHDQRQPVSGPRPSGPHRCRAASSWGPLQSAFSGAYSYPREPIREQLQGAYRGLSRVLSSALGRNRLSSRQRGQLRRRVCLSPGPGVSGDVLDILLAPVRPALASQVGRSPPLQLDPPPGIGRFAPTCTAPARQSAHGRPARF
jgi:hypothetical protein